MSKRKDLTYRSGRSCEWLKSKNPTNLLAAAEGRLPAGVKPRRHRAAAVAQRRGAEGLRHGSGEIPGLQSGR